MQSNIKGFFNNEGKLEIWPSKPAKKLLVIQFLASKFEVKKTYSEQEVNDIIKSFADYNDHVLLRRELFEHGILNRTIDGRNYWKSNMPEKDGQVYS